MVIQFTLSMPPSINETYRTHGHFTYKTKQARDWETQAGWEMKSIYREKHDSEADVSITLDFYFKRERDIDSGIKILLDFLQTKVYKNDRQVKRLIVNKYRDTEKPRVEIKIESYK